MRTEFNFYKKEVAVEELSIQDRKRLLMTFGCPYRFERLDNLKGEKNCSEKEPHEVPFAFDKKQTCHRAACYCKQTLGQSDFEKFSDQYLCIDSTESRSSQELNKARLEFLRKFGFVRQSRSRADKAKQSSLK